MAFVYYFYYLAYISQSAKIIWLKLAKKMPFWGQNH
jgi:hypothetical protein